MLRAMSSAVSGLQNNQTAMDVIGNNIANVNTIGFKASTVTFSQMLSQTLSGASAPQNGLGGINPMQIGLGTQIAAISTPFTSSSTENTGVNTDLAIQGNGFFIVNNGSQNFYTRDGSFNVDANGNLVNSAGLKVQGWQADSSGVVNPSGPVSDLKIPIGQSMPAKQSNNITMTGNLDASQYANTSSSTTPYAVTSSGAIYDSLGVSHSVTTVITPTGTQNTWKWRTLTTLPSADVPSKTAAAPSGPATATGNITLSFNGYAIQSIVGDNVPYNISITVQNGDTTSTIEQKVINAINNDQILKNYFVASNNSGSVNLQSKLVDPTGTYGTNWLTITENDGSTGAATGLNNFSYASSDVGTTPVSNVYATSGYGTLTFNSNGSLSNVTTTYPTPSTSTATLLINPSTGASTPWTPTINFSGMTQYGGSSSLNFASQDGYSSGSLQSYSIDQSGVITGTYSNGLTNAIGQIALANFPNPSGLTSNGSNIYSTSSNSGTAQIGAAGSGGIGTIIPSALEMSNVDLSQQFTNLITTERGYEANARVITTSDQMLQDLLSLKAAP
ncbi:flagellar hook-basal body protein [Thermodesulfobium narugense DSM 14796]|uniref:Flagellar hook protein FlgE n=1 Tax=Thermodesulfobium narugense DSM 14796 TaxID=747365 RepID=M1E9K1_9BACT|nr:flagellar hook-basal body complex protein [Thermodesulfobium narugense]AEE15419.1 flagellar hook-basal body protein [Thermodesulfobium narugense DSM 14796]